MKIYSDFSLRRSFQILSDLVVIAVIAFGVWLGVKVASTVSALAGLGRQVEDAGRNFGRAMSDAGETLATIPFAGDAIRVPFDHASETGAVLEEAGQTTQSVILTIALVAGVMVAAVIILTVCWWWVRHRIGFARRATEANRISRMEGGVDVLALRALVTATSKGLHKIGPNPVMGWRAGDQEIMTRLAQLELREAGVRLAR